jgi:molybdate transport system substrate-binding protein
LLRHSTSATSRCQREAVIGTHERRIALIQEVVSSAVAEPVLASGQVIAGSETPLATVSVGIAVRIGAPKPNIATADEVKRVLLGAKYISFPNAEAGAAAGVSFEETIRKLGIAEAMKPKIKPAQGGRGAMALLAKGDIDIGLTFISEIITEPGVEVVGPLPRVISTPTALATSRRKIARRWHLARIIR